MHIWYVALVMQFYVVYPLLLMGAKKVGGDKIYTWCICIIGLASFVLYLLPAVPFAQKFYLLPARLFEFAAGGLIALNVAGLLNVRKQWSLITIIGLIVVLMFCNGSLDNA